MAAQSPPPGSNIYTDILTEFSQGMNSGVLPQLLPKSQAAFAINTTFRGAFASHRPPLLRVVLAFSSEELRVAVESGFFQGAGWYRPDFGPLQLVAQISGRLFTFTKNESVYDVVEITVPLDPNSSTASQVWMWQSEKWLIITDGTAALPIFYDGVTSRRSMGPSVELAIVDAVGSAGPNPIGEVVETTVTEPWTYGFGQTVLFNGEFYQAVQGSSQTPTYNVLLTNVGASPGSTVPSRSVIQIIPANVGTMVTNDSASQPAPWNQFTGVMSSVASLAVGDVVTIVIDEPVFVGPFNWMVLSIDEASKSVVFKINGGYTFGSSVGISDGQVIYHAPPNGPNVIVGTTTSSFINPDSGETVSVPITAPYTGSAGQVVWIGSNQYTIEVAPPPEPSTTLYLLNLTDTTAITGLPKPILSVPELPAGRMGEYGLGQNWMSLVDGITFIAGDIVGSQSGSDTMNYRDAVLKTTGLTFFGGSFHLPGSGAIINSMTFTANLDTSLGQGALQVGTDSNIFSCKAPFDYSTATLGEIILTESLIGFGPLAQNSTVLANSDMLFRSFLGLGSLILARRQFEQELTWGNTPISREMTRVFTRDNEALLPYGSAVVFDNRLLITCSPNISGQGTFHLGLVALNFDLVSSLRGKAPPVYDGMWTGLNALQIINVQSGSEARAFIFGLDIPNSKIELYELLKTEDGVYFDNGVSPIRWIIETPVMFNQDVKPLPELVRITNGEIWVQDIVGTVNVVVQYRPDFYSGSEQPGCWETWTEFEICATAVGENVRPSYRTRIGLGEPSGTRCQDGNNRPFRVGHFFQFRIEFIGSCKFMALRVEAVVQPQADFAQPDCDVACLPAPELPELVIP